MAKGKKGDDKKGKGDKGDKGKKEEAPPEKVEPPPILITEVDKTFYELQIADLNRKLGRLRTLTTELEEKNEQLTESNQKLDEDRSDVIVYLKRSLQEKSDEINDVQERLQGLQEKREMEIDDFQEKISDLQSEYKHMQEQLSSEIKLLCGKLNSLEEFRVQRDDIMKKYEIQEAAMEEQEIRHKREIYNIEKKFIIGKDKVKKEMEARILELSTEFQDATNLRIAATTHRVIRENIAINNELDVILETHERLQVENEKLKMRDRTLRQEAELREAETKKALTKSQVQFTIIDRLTKEHDHLTARIDAYQDLEKAAAEYKKKLQESELTIGELKHIIRILEQNLHASRCERVTIKTDFEYASDEVDRLSNILQEAVVAIQQALEIKETSDEALNAARRESLLNNLLKLMSKVHEQVGRHPSLESVDSIAATYVKGDLGFVPKPVVLRSRLPIKHNVQSQVGSSFEEFAAAKSETVLVERLRDFMGEEEESRIDEESHVSEKEEYVEVVRDEESQVFFDDEPEPPSISSEEAPEVDLTVVEFPKIEIKAKESEEKAEGEAAAEGEVGGEQTPGEQTAGEQTSGEQTPGEQTDIEQTEQTETEIGTEEATDGDEVPELPPETSPEEN